jgi:Trp operon repressor
MKNAINTIAENILNGTTVLDGKTPGKEEAIKDHAVIFKLLKQGLTQKEVALRYGVSINTISRFVRKYIKGKKPR